MYHFKTSGPVAHSSGHFEKKRDESLTTVGIVQPLASQYSGYSDNNRAAIL
jgi:hypothetical protein